MTPFLWALAVGLGTGLVLALEHYVFSHIKRLKLYPPDAYTVGVLTLFGGYFVWAGVAGVPLWIIEHLLLVTVLGGIGTRLAWWWHARQDTARAGQTEQTLEKGAADG